MNERLNFSPAPFKARTSDLTILWTVNLVLLATLLFFTWRWVDLNQQNSSVHGDLDVVRTDQRAIVDQNDLLVEALEKVDVRAYGKQLQQFGGIESAFGTHWGRLLDDLGGLMPEDVRLVSIRPSSSLLRRRPGQKAFIEVAAEARGKNAQLTFIQNLQVDPSFQDVSLDSEEYEGGRVAVAFTIRFVYKPEKGAS